MIIGRPIAPRAFYVHPHQKISIINAFGMFIQEDEGLGRRWVKNRLSICAVYQLFPFILPFMDTLRTRGKVARPSVAVLRSAGHL